MPTNVQPSDAGVRLLGTLWFKDPSRLRCQADGAEMVIVHTDGPLTLGFESLDQLDAVIGRLTEIRYAVATRQQAKADREPRENPVPCKVCTHGGTIWHTTFNLDRIHDDCRVAEAVSA